MKTSLNISLDTRRSKKDGTYPLVFRLGHKQRTTSIPINIYLKEKDWDSKNRLIRKSYTGNDNPSRLNNQLNKKKSDLWDQILKLNEAGHLRYMSISELKEKLVGEESPEITFFDFVDQEITLLRKSNRFGTARSYLGVISIVKVFHQKPILRFEEITYTFLTKFEAFHYSKGNNANSLAVYMRTIRAIYNKGIKAGIVDKDIYPFTNYKIKTRPTEKRALDWDLLSIIINKTIKPEEPCFDARNYFICSYMMYGMNFKDMAYLKKTDIKDGRIHYRRDKTSKIFDIKVNRNLESLLQYYGDRNSESNFIFPIIKRTDPFEQDKDILWARERYNKSLKQLAQICGIETNLTSYVSRHSFATQAMLQDVPVNAISAMLGHSSIKTTEIYLKSLPSNILDNYNEKILVKLTTGSLAL